MTRLLLAFFDWTHLKNNQSNYINFIQNNFVYIIVYHIVIVYNILTDVGLSISPLRIKITHVIIDDVKKWTSGTPNVKFVFANVLNEFFTKTKSYVYPKNQT